MIASTSAAAVEQLRVGALGLRVHATGLAATAGRPRRPAGGPSPAGRPRCARSVGTSPAISANGVASGTSPLLVLSLAGIPLSSPSPTATGDDHRARERGVQAAERPCGGGPATSPRSMAAAVRAHRSRGGTGRRGAGRGEQRALRVVVGGHAAAGVAAQRGGRRARRRRAGRGARRRAARRARGRGRGRWSRRLLMPRRPGRCRTRLRPRPRRSPLARRRGPGGGSRGRG